MSRLAVLVCCAGLVFAAAERARAASPLSEAITAIRSLFSSGPSAEPLAAPRASEAEAAYRDALALRARGDTARAVERLRDAAAAGHAGAAYELGMLYTQGRDLPRDLEQGAQWINRAADGGDARAQFLVGANLMSGAGGVRDPSRGVAFLARAGEQGHARAQNLLGQAYVDGVGVPANPGWAARWYGRAARAGHAQAQYAYGVMYGSGLGLPRSREQAYRWASLAARGGHPSASEVAASLARQLPVPTIERLRSDAAAFVPAVQARTDDVPTVMFAQDALRVAGFDPGPVDGLMGPRTRAAIRAYERRVGAPESGRISSTLLEQLIARTSVVAR